MLLWASRVIRRIRPGNDVPEVLPGKWSELCLMGKQAGKNSFVRHFRTSAGRRATEESSDGLSIGELVLPQDIPSAGSKGRGKDGSCVYTLQKIPKARPGKLAASNQQNMQ